MKVLLTGATGLVGSHVLDRLIALNVPVRILLRSRSSLRFIPSQVTKVEIAPGTIDDAKSLDSALASITHVIHCAGCTKAIDYGEFYRTNQLGTKNLVEAINRQGGIKCLVHTSSLAAAGPALARSPGRETDTPHPVSEYGKSKLAGEHEVQRACRIPYIILRPPGVYGPREGEFYKLFKAAQNHLLPKFGGGRQELSLVYVEDLAAAMIHCLDQSPAAGQVFNVAHPEILTAGQLAETIAQLLGTWTLRLPLPTWLLWPACAAQEVVSRWTGKANVINRQKYAELAAPGWVCDPARLKAVTGFVAATSLADGLARTLAWYRQEQWL